LNTQIKNLEKEMAKRQSSLEKATAIREKEHAEFFGEEKELLESIAALKAAVAVLAKHHGGSLMQLPQTHLLGVAATLQHEMHKHAELLKGVLTHKQQREVAAFVRAPSELPKQSFAPQSGQVFGILKQMKESFESNLSESQKAEVAAQKAYEELRAALKEQIAAAKESMDKKTQELAAIDLKLAQAKEDIEDTQEKLAADEEFLQMLKEKCQRTDQEFAERQKTRGMEMEAVSKALAILSSDDAHDLFTKTFNAAFLQTERSSRRSLRLRALEVIKAAAQKFNSPRLSALAVMCRIDAFTRVKAAIDDMIRQLMKEKQDEVKQKDFCVKELNANQLETEKKDREKADLVEKIETLKMTIESLTKEIESLKAEIAEMQVQLKRAGEDREKENKEFQLAVTDQRATQKILQAALAVLKGFYNTKEAGALVQQKQGQPAGPPPPPGFKSYKTSTRAGGVMGLIQQIINDARAVEAETIKAEADAQDAYEGFVKETNTSIEAAKKAIVSKSEEKATTEVNLVDAEKDLEAVELELDRLSNYNIELHKSCDFVLKNFEIRQRARDEEVEALKQAKAILSGANFEAFLENADSV